MLRRARISFLAALIAATAGFLGLLEVSIAQPLFYSFIGFTILSLLLALFEAEKRETPGTSRQSEGSPRPRLRPVEPLRIGR